MWASQEFSEDQVGPQFDPEQLLAARASGLDFDTIQKRRTPATTPRPTPTRTSPSPMCGPPGWPPSRNSPTVFPPAKAPSPSASTKTYFPS